MRFPVGWDKRQLSRAGPPYRKLLMVGRRSLSLAGPTLGCSKVSLLSSPVYPVFVPFRMLDALMRCA